jgi:hypothetical protein
MNRDQFWQLIETAKQGSDCSNEHFEDILHALLIQQEPENILKFRAFLGFYLDSADTIPLWMAGKTILGYCSDDTFLYFRLWLISQGKTVYLNALKDPDSLADSDASRYAEEELNFEQLIMIPLEAYEEATGRSFDEIFEMQLHRDLTDKEATEALSEIILADDDDVLESEDAALEAIPQRLPQLSEQFKFSPEDDLNERTELRELAAKVQSGEISSESLIDSFAEALRAVGIAEKNIQDLAQVAFPSAPTHEDYEEISPMLVGRAKVSKGGKVGFIDESGKEIIPCIYDSAQSFCIGKEDLTPVMKDGKHGLIDRDGKELAPLIYDEIDCGYKSDYKNANRIPKYIWRGKKDGKWKVLLEVICD